MAFEPGPLNHIELAYRPGERELARSIFELFGCETWDNSFGNLVVDHKILLYEASPEQWAAEQEFAAFLESSGGTTALNNYLSALRATPQRYHHFSFGYRTEKRLEETIERVEKAAASGPLAGRVEVASTFRPGDPGSAGDHIIQSFVRSDVFSVGSLVLGQTIELQHYFMSDTSRPRNYVYVNPKLVGNSA